MKLRYIASLALYTFIFSGFAFADVRVEGNQVQGLEVEIPVSQDKEPREQAILEAHRMAFKAFVDHHFVEKIPPLPSNENLLDMGEALSIQKEKATPSKYQATFNITFKKGSFEKWAKKEENLPSQASSKQENASSPSTAFSAPQAREIEKTLEIIIHHFQDWTEFQSVLKQLPDVKQFDLQLSQIKGKVRLAWKGTEEELEIVLRTGGFSVTKNPENLHVWSVEKTPSIPMLNLGRLSEKQ